MTTPMIYPAACLSPPMLATPRERSQLPIYLDHNATTPVDPRVAEAVFHYLSEHFGNPASRTHVFGRIGDHAVEVARQQIATLIGAADLEEVTITSGATHSNALAVTGAARLAPRGRDHIITSNVEHQSHFDACDALARQGFEITRIPVDSRGLVDPDDVAGAITQRTFLISIMLAQNVIGTLQPIAELGALSRAHDLWFHVDAAQGLGLVPFDVEAMHIDMASLSAHKLHGPKGAGALYVRRGVRRAALAHDRDPWTPRGTLNVPAIVGFGRAAEIMTREGGDEASRLGALRDRLYSRLSLQIPLSLNGAHTPRHPGNLNISIPTLHSVELAALRQQIAISHGSACSSSSTGASHVLLAIGVPEAQARAALRIGVGRFTTMDDLDAAAEFIIQATRASEQRSARASTGASLERMVVNCEGRRVRINDDGAALCAVSDADTYLVGSGEHSLGTLHALGKPPRINIVIPSYCSGPELGKTLGALLAQRFVFPGELVIFVNEPPDAAAGVRRQNDDTERWITALISGSPHVPEHARPYHPKLCASLARLGSTVTLRCVRQTIHGGMPAVYQTITSAYVHRLRAHYDRIGGDRARQSRWLEDTSRRTFLLICDDDVCMEGDDAVERAYYHATVHDAVILGALRIDIQSVGRRWDEILCPVLQGFLDVKQSLNANALSPRGLLVRHIIEGGNVDLHEPFGDQLYFARLAADRARHLVPGRTSLREADYPSNGRFLRDLKRYMEGADNHALSIFHNLIELLADGGQTPYSTDDIQSLIAALKSRDRRAVATITEDLLQRPRS